MLRLILLTDFTEAFAHNLQRGILNYSKGREPWVVCRMPPSYKQRYGLSGVLEWALRWGADAIIAQFDNRDDVSLFRRNGIVALAQDYKQRFAEIPNITSRYHETGIRAADFFLSKGFRHFAFYGYRDTVWAEERCAGFRRRIGEAGFGDHFHEYLHPSVDRLWYYDSEPLTRWLSSLPRPTALMACDDTLGSRILEVCRVQGIRVPEELAVLGVDNDELTCALSDPPLSSVSLDIVRGGYEAARLIDSLRNDPSRRGEDIVIEPSVIIDRASTDVYATDDPEILQALRFIHRHLAESFSVADIVSRVPLSRRLLEMRFRQATGCSLHQYVTRLRVRRMAQLLVTTSLPLADIALETGLPDVRNLSRIFKGETGCTPMEYRRRHSSPL